MYIKREEIIVIVSVLKRWLKDNPDNIISDSIKNIIEKLENRI